MYEHWVHVTLNVLEQERLLSVYITTFPIIKHRKVEIYESQIKANTFTLILAFGRYLGSFFFESAHRHGDSVLVRDVIHRSRT